MNNLSNPRLKTLSAWQKYDLLVPSVPKLRVLSEIYLSPIRQQYLIAHAQAETKYPVQPQSILRFGLES